MITLFKKGYNFETEEGVEKLLYGCLNEYGPNFNHKDNIDLFKDAHKPENCIKLKQKK